MSLRLIQFSNFYLGIINWNKDKAGKLSFLNLNFKKKLLFLGQCHYYTYRHTKFLSAQIFGFIP